MQGNNSSTPPASVSTDIVTKPNTPPSQPSRESRVISVKPIVGSDSRELRKEKRPSRFEDLASPDQLIVVQEIESALIYFMELGLPVYLDGLGILFPKIERSNRVKNLKEKFVLYSEEYRTIGFEKCYELVALHRERFNGVLETRDLGQRVYERGSAFLSVSFSENEIRRFVRGAIDKLRKEVVQAGRSYMLQTIGDFFALHNRQGETFSDWYAGADIFLKTRYQKILKTTPSKFLNRPIFNDSSEPFSALYGSPVTTLTIDLHSELKGLGYEISNEEATSLNPRTFSVAVFSTPDKDKQGAVILTYVTEGLRLIGLSKSSQDPKGTEFVVQTLIEPESSFGTVSKVDLDLQTIPTWPIKVFTAGWILLQSSKNGRVKAGAGLAVGSESLFTEDDSALSTVFATKFLTMAGEQLSPQGAFEYISLIVIASDEAEVATLHTPHLLLTILEYKKLNQVTRPHRSSLVAKTGLLASH